MGGNFDDVVGGVGVRFGEVGDDNLVDALTLTLGASVWSGRPHPLGFIGQQTRQARFGFCRRAGEGACSTIFRLDQLTERCLAGHQIMLKSKHRQRDRPGLKAGDTHYTNAAPTGWSGNGDNGVVKVHRAIVGAAAFSWKAVSGALYPYHQLAGIQSAASLPSSEVSDSLRAVAGEGARATYADVFLGIRPLGQGFSRGLGRRRLVVLRIHHHITAQAFAFALGAQVAMVA